MTPKRPQYITKRVKPNGTMVQKGVSQRHFPPIDGTKSNSSMDVSAGDRILFRDFKQYVLYIFHRYFFFRIGMWALNSISAFFESLIASLFLSRFDDFKLCCREYNLWTSSACCNNMLLI